MFTARLPRRPTIGTVNGGGFLRPAGAGSSAKSSGRGVHFEVTDSSGARNATMIPMTRVCGSSAS